MSPELMIVMFVLLMASVWYNFRQGYKKGITSGYTAGVYKAVQYLQKNAQLSATVTEDGRPATAEEFTNFIMEELQKDYQKSRA